MPAKRIEYIKEHDVRNWVASRNGHATFISRNGRMYGMDSDTQITLISNSKVEVTEFGVGIMSYKGEYTTDDTGLIRVTLNGYGSKWPEMYLFRSTDSAILLRRDQKPGFNLGDRGAGTETPDMNPYWPFRLAKPTDDEKR